MIRRYAAMICLGLGTALVGCGDLGGAQAISRTIDWDGTSYDVDYSVQQVTEVIPAPGGGATEARFDASVIEIARADGAPVDVSATEALAIASAFCESARLTKAPVAGSVSRLGAGWRVQNHCGSAFA